MFWGFFFFFSILFPSQLLASLSSQSCGLLVATVCTSLVPSAGCATLRAVRLPVAMKKCEIIAAPSERTPGWFFSSVISDFFSLLHSPSLIARVNITDFYFPVFHFLLQSCSYLISLIISEKTLFAFCK